MNCFGDFILQYSVRGGVCHVRCWYMQWRNELFDLLIMQWVCFDRYSLLFCDAQENNRMSVFTVPTVVR